MVLQAILIGWAWRRGWKAWALLPLALDLLFALLFVSTQSPLKPGDADVLILGDVFSIIVLIIMAVAGKPKAAPDATNAPPAP